jgi:hypothetical protein
VVCANARRPSHAYRRLIIRLSGPGCLCDIPVKKDTVLSYMHEVLGVSSLRLIQLSRSLHQLPGVLQ